VVTGKSVYRYGGCHTLDGLRQQILDATLHAAAPAVVEATESELQIIGRIISRADGAISKRLQTLNAEHSGGCKRREATKIALEVGAAGAEIRIAKTGMIGTILQHLNGRTLRPIVSFLLGTGCRRGEALALRWKDIDWPTARVYIERSLEQTKKGGLRFKAPKTRNSRRNISISPWLLTELRAHRARQQERRMSLGIGKAPEDSLVFARWDGSTRAPHWLTQKFRLAMNELNIECTLHALRHTHVSQLIAAGMDILTISRRIGHASAAITLRVYGHLFANTDEKAAEILEIVFAKVRTE